MAASDGTRIAPAAPRVLVLILASDRLPWRYIEDSGQATTWVADFAGAGIDTFWYSGTQPTARQLRTSSLFEAAKGMPWLARHTTALLPLQQLLMLRPNGKLEARVTPQTPLRIRVDVPDVIPFMCTRLLASLRYLGAADYDYVVRTNSSSYLSLPGVMATISSMAISNATYAGTLNSIRSESWVSGSGMILARSAVMSLINANAHWRHELTEDRAIGRILKRAGHQVLVRDRIDVETVSQVRDWNRSRVARFLSSDGFQVRCKAVRRTDAVDIMHEVHGVLTTRGSHDWE